MSGRALMVRTLRGGGSLAQGVATNPARDDITGPEPMRVVQLQRLTALAEAIRSPTRSRMQGIESIDLKQEQAPTDFTTLLFINSYSLLDRCDQCIVLIELKPVL